MTVVVRKKKKTAWTVAEDVALWGRVILDGFVLEVCPLAGKVDAAPEA